MQQQLIGAVLTAMLCSGAALAGEAEHHHHHGQQDTALSLDHGNKWAIDASLHTGMNRIKSSLEKNLHAIHHDHFTVSQYQVLAGEMQSHLDYLFANCKLPPAADAQLHLLLVRVMQGVAMMKEGEMPRDGAITLVKALKTYPRYFNDPNWQEIKH